MADALGVSRQTVIAWEQRAYPPQYRAEAYLRVVRELASDRRRKIEGL